MPAAADPAPMVPHNAAAEAATYEHCMKLARQNPAAAQKLASTWHERGGAHPADHCAAVALIGLKRYKEAATRLEALAQAMTTAPAGLRAEVLDQAGQAWGLAGDPVRAYAAAGAAVALQPNDPDLLIDRAEAAASAGFFDKAVADLDHVLKAEPARVDALVYRAAAYRALDRLDPALADVERALARSAELRPGAARARQYPAPRGRSCRGSPGLAAYRAAGARQPGRYCSQGKYRASRSQGRYACAIAPHPLRRHGTRPCAASSLHRLLSIFR